MKADPKRKDREITGEIWKQMEIYGYRRDEIAIFLHTSMSTLDRRLQEPSKFTLKEMRILKDKLKIDFSAFI